MRLDVPLIPLAITIERRPPGPIRRFGLRRAMAAIAILAVLMGLVANILSGGRRKRELSQKAFQYSCLFDQDRSLVRETAGTAVALDQSALDLTRRASTIGDHAEAARLGRLATDQRDIAARARQGVRHWSARAAYHDRLRRKYAFAARYPWLPILPDSPEP